MKIRVLILLFLSLFSCNKAIEKENKNYKAKTESIIPVTKPPENKLDNLKFKLEFEKISDIIKSTFNVKNIEPKKLYKSTQTEYYKLIDSSKVIDFKRYSNFLIIEFENPTSAKIEFEKIKTIAKKSINNRRNITEYHHIFSKGGISFNQIDKWIICHLLSCNMNPKDYEIDKKFTSNLETLNIEVDWITSTCGWGKLELK